MWITLMRMQLLAFQSGLMAMTFVASSCANPFDVSPDTQAPRNGQKKLFANDGERDDHFGISVSVSGSRAIIGSEGEKAYVFDVENGRQLFKLTDPNGKSGDLFGRSVAISGKIAIVGAQGADATIEEENNGAAFLFDVSTGLKLFKLTGENVPVDGHFGWSVALNGDIAAVGAKNEKVYLYDVRTGKPTRTLSCKEQLDSSFGETPGFGASVAVSSNIVIVGAPRASNDNGGGAGSACVLDAKTGKLLHTLIADDPVRKTRNQLELNHFGHSVAISGNIAIVGVQPDRSLRNASGAAYVFDVRTGKQLRKLVPTDVSNHGFGISVGLSGNVSIVGDGFNNAVFMFDATTGKLTSRLTVKDQYDLQDFGGAISIDDQSIIVGSIRAFGRTNTEGSLEVSGGAFVFPR